MAIMKARIALAYLTRTANQWPYPRPQPGYRNFNAGIPLGSETPLEGFFSQYPKFKSRPSNSLKVEFDRLCKLYGWRDRERKAARKAFNIALKEEFDDLYGSDEHDIKNWHKLCHVLRIHPVPDTLRECRAVVVNKHVNLMDLVRGSKEDVTIFNTEKELSVYTKGTKNYFPKAAAKDGGVLRALRRNIEVPREDTSSSRKNKSHKGLRG